MNIYTTIQGDMWDSIAKKVYGTEKAMDILMKVNPEHLTVAVFGAGVEILLPQFTVQEAASNDMPPWRK